MSNTIIAAAVLVLSAACGVGLVFVAVSLLNGANHIFRYYREQGEALQKERDKAWLRSQASLVSDDPVTYRLVLELADFDDSAVAVRNWRERRKVQEESQCQTL